MVFKNPKAFCDHDHARCIGAALERVERTCEKKGLRLTHARRRVLEILLADHRAMGAYEVLDKLRDDGPRAEPPIVYRALDFLVEHRFAHRIHRLNAFVACVDPGHAEVPAFLICRNCNQVAETRDVADAGAGPWDGAARDMGFRIERMVVEAMGLCPACQDAA